MTEAARHSPSGSQSCRGMDTTASAFGGGIPELCLPEETL